jgi:hypothetical protein
MIAVIALSDRIVDYNECIAFHKAVVALDAAFSFSKTPGMFELTLILDRMITG